MNNQSMLSCATAVCAVLCLNSPAASAEDAGSQPAEPAAPAAPTAMSQPAMSGPLAANPNPTSFDLGRAGTIYVTGAVTGFAQWQDVVGPGERRSQADISNGHVIVQKTDGLVQFYMQAGTYSLPALGTPYVRASKTPDDYFGVVPVAFAKIAPDDSFSIQAGKLPTLIGAEYTFTYENVNIDRGLLWNQENAVNQGVQANYTVGPLAFSLSVNDGFYSNTLNWVTGSATYTFDPINAVSFVAGGNADKTTKSTLATPIAQNNSQIYNVIYTYTSDPWMVQPYLQYTDVPTNRTLGILHDASTFGGALLAKYSFPTESPLEGVSLPLRVEFINSSGNKKDPSTNLLGYGPGSDAWSVTVTPTYQYKILFARAEASYVGIGSATNGLAFGSKGNDKGEARLVFETGVIF
jgi:hypothetical protein